MAGDVLKTFLLLVTWLMHDQPPSNYQVTFSSFEACEAARLKVIDDRTAHEAGQMNRNCDLVLINIWPRVWEWFRRLSHFLCGSTAA